MVFCKASRAMPMRAALQTWGPGAVGGASILSDNESNEDGDPPTGGDPVFVQTHLLQTPGAMRFRAIGVVPGHAPRVARDPNMWAPPERPSRTPSPFGGLDDELDSPTCPLCMYHVDGVHDKNGTSGNVFALLRRKYDAHKIDMQLPALCALLLGVYNVSALNPYVEAQKAGGDALDAVFEDRDDEVALHPPPVLTIEQMMHHFTPQPIGCIQDVWSDYKEGRKGAKKDMDDLAPFVFQTPTTNPNAPPVGNAGIPDSDDEDDERAPPVVGSGMPRPNPVVWRMRRQARKDMIEYSEKLERMRNATMMARKRNPTNEVGAAEAWRGTKKKQDKRRRS